MGADEKIHPISPAYNVYSIIARRIIDRGAVGELNLTTFSREITIELSEAYSCSRPELAGLLEASSLTIDEVFKHAASFFDIAFLLEIETRSRLVVHTRNPFMPLEVGIAWHPYLNLPYVPSSTIKGALRAYLERQKEMICNVFLSGLIGTEDEVSGIFVTDALPVKCSERLIEPDVLTPHYSEVGGLIDEARAKPTPLVFPTIAPGVRLKFVLALRELKAVDARCLVEQLPGVISRAFEFGVGAKTSVGYGAVSIKLLNYATPG